MAELDENVGFAVRLISLGDAGRAKANQVVYAHTMKDLDSGPLPYDVAVFGVEDNATRLVEGLARIGAVARLRRTTRDGAELIPSLPEKPVNDSAPGNVATQILMLQGITRDPALQCRAQLDEATVAKYAEVVDKLPPVRIIRDGGTDYLVDGWHRFQAHVVAKRDTIHAVVEPGTRRDAILAAVQANSSHGLPRSHDDTRRAVKVLLMDEEWCKLSDRKLAAMADVSHTHVANQRKQYGVKAGTVLDPAEANRIDGKMSPEWEALAKDLKEWDKQKFEKIRAAKTPAELLPALPEHWDGFLNKVFELRAEELATGTWPWSDDMTHEDVEARFNGADDVGDILAMAGSVSLTPHQRKVAYTLARQAGDIEKTFYPGHFVDAFKGRPALEARMAERVAEMRAAEAAKPKDPWQQAQEIQKEPNVLRQSTLVSECSVAVYHQIQPKSLLPAVRDGVYVDRMKIGGDWANPTPMSVTTCPVPECGGVVRPSKQTWEQTCIRCDTNAPGWWSKQRDALKCVAELLKHPDYGFIVNGVVIDHAAIERIRVLQAAALAKPANTVKLGEDPKEEMDVAIEELEAQWQAEHEEEQDNGE